MESLNIKSLLCYNATEDSLRYVPVFCKQYNLGDFMQDNQRQALPKMRESNPNLYEERKYNIAYAAGLIDGEGSFCFRKAETPNTLKATNRISPVYSGVIRIGMTQRLGLEILDATFPGGSLLCEGVRKDRPTYQVMYRWELRKKHLVIEAIKELLPYLKAKHAQAELLLETLVNWKNPVNRKLGLDPKELQRRDLAWSKMRQLNAVGAAATTNSRSIREDEVIV